MQYSTLKNDTFLISPGPREGTIIQSSTSIIFGNVQYNITVLDSLLPSAHSSMTFKLLSDFLNAGWMVTNLRNISAGKEVLFVFDSIDSIDSMIA